MMNKAPKLTNQQSTGLWGIAISWIFQRRFWQTANITLAAYGARYLNFTANLCSSILYST
jgi:hypothetical protein